MFGNIFGNIGDFRESRFQEGCRDRHAGILPRKKNHDYLEGYLQDRPAGLDVVVAYFPTVEDYMMWKLNHSKSSN